MLPKYALSVVSSLSLTAAAPVTDSYFQSDAASTVVDLEYAKYEGQTNAAGINEFLGMRYASPPLGELRFRAPVDPVSNSTAQKATAFGPTCFGPGGYEPTGNAPTSEDCLFVNVFSPSNATSNSQLPVWVYIQGGGFAANSNPNYNGTDVILASGKSIVFVNLNYRVGSFGFLASERVRQDGDLNAGLLDQRKALQWVQKYIHQFGGDPKHVVIHGASAGAGSIAYQLAAYGGRDDGLFVGGMSESPFFPYHPQVSELEFQFDIFAKSLSCAETSTASVMACLRSKSTAEIADATVVLPFPNTTVTPDWYWLPVVDGNFSRQLLYPALETGKFVKVPVIVGNDLSEGNGFAANAATSDAFLAFIKSNYPRLTREDLAKINATYPLMPPLPEHNAWFPSAALAYGDATFTCPGNQIAASVAKYAGADKVFNYLYNVTDLRSAAAGNAVPHTAETIPIFGVGETPNAAACEPATCSYATYNAPIIPIVMDYWISFVKHLNPNLERNAAAPVWSSWGTAAGQRLQFILNDTHDEAVPKELISRCNLWRSLVPNTEQ